ncbi:hypothetical protein R3P38DRAFT_2828809 [Favolaschia claudopus]|uniref:Uncharacterized protein n=1 Tax=Favolaschia claudopus TaxID=2862362 RepID=A0AAW0E9F5_9AGAR
MSWTSSYPPPRRSRSRSPGRGSYPPREPPYPPDQYRGDWEAYDRERAWAAYDRDRGLYDYRRRSRSPPPELTRKRQRSGSPYDRERYDPHVHRQYGGYSSPPRRHASGYPPNRRQPPDPTTFDYPASLKQFAEWFRFFHPTQAVEEDNADKAAEQEAGDGSKPRNGIKTRWGELRTMFEHHRRSPWFAEKYDPAKEYDDLRKRRCQRRACLRPAPTNGNAAPISEEPKAGGDDDEMQFNMNVDEDLPADTDANRLDANGKNASNAANNKRSSDRGDEVSVMPEGNQVMIRTIPPDIGRMKLEDACSKVPGFVYIALGDPLQKRNFYRAGIEGFKLHVTHNVKPFTNRMRYAPEVASRPDRMEKDLVNVKALAAKLEVEAADAPADGEDAPWTRLPEEELEEDPEPREVGKSMADLRAQDLVDINNEKAYEVKKVRLGVLLRFHLTCILRTCGAAFHTCYYCAIITDLLEELQRKCIKHDRKPLSKMLLEELKAAERGRGKRPLRIKNLQRKTEATRPAALEEKDNEKDKDKETKPSDVTVSNDKDWRRTDERWVEWLDSKIALLINREGVDPREYGGKAYEDELKKAVEPYLKQEDEGSSGATAFVEKHIANKHPELVNKPLDELPYFNNSPSIRTAFSPSHTHLPLLVADSNYLHRRTECKPARPLIVMGVSQYRDGGGYGQSGYPPSGYGGGGSQWGDLYGREGYPPGYGYQGRGGRDDGGPNGRRLSDRLGGFAEGMSGAGLPQKPAPTMDGALVSGNGGGNRGGRGGRGGGGAGPLPPPPPHAKEDPRAAAGKRVSYHDMDLVAEGDVELSY